MSSSLQRFSKHFYPRACMEAAINNYSAIATVSLSEDETYYTCRFEECRVEPGLVILEFGNHLIELLNSQKAITPE